MILEAFWIVYLVMEHHLPFRGLMSDQIAESIKEYGFRHYIVGWLPTWWFILGCSMLSAGVGLGCSIWAMVGEMQGQPVGVPLLIGATSLVSAFAGLVVPIVLAWFKDRSESRQMNNLKERVHELELQVALTQQAHVENATNIQKIAVAAEKIVQAKEQLKSVVEDNMQRIETMQSSKEDKKDRPEQDT